MLHGRDLTTTGNARHSVNLLVDSRANPVLDAHCPCQFDYVDRACDSEVHCPSPDDERAEEHLKASCKFVDGHYDIGLPWKQGYPDLSNNYDMALARLNSLGKRLKTDTGLHERYRDKIQDMVLKGYAVEVSKSSKCEDGRVWYIPHHCVFSKFGVVFDCAAHFCGTSLNNQILQGPDDTNNLVGVVTRFRKNAVFVVSDVWQCLYR